MTNLPTINVFNMMMVVVDKIGKLSSLVPCRSGKNQLIAPQVTKLFFENCVHFFGVPKYVIHDRDVCFTVLFQKVLWSIIGTRTLFSGAYYP